MFLELTRRSAESSGFIDQLVHGIVRGFSWRLGSNMANLLGPIVGLSLVIIIFGIYFYRKNRNH